MTRLPIAGQNCAALAAFPTVRRVSYRRKRIPLSANVLVRRGLVSIRASVVRGSQAGQSAEEGLDTRLRSWQEAGMNTLEEICGSAVAFTYRSIDRLILNAYRSKPLQYP